MERVMQGRRGFISLLFLMLCLLLPWSGSDARTEDDHGTIKIGGTGGAYGVMTQVAAAFQKRCPRVRVEFSPSLGSTGGIKAVLAGVLDLGLSARPLTEEERRQGAVAVEYGRTPLILVTSHKGTAINFTLKQIASFYSGEINSYPDGAPIRLILRPMTESDTAFLLSLSPEMAAAVRTAQARDGMVIVLTDRDNANTLEKITGAMGWMTLAQLISEKRPLTPVAIHNVRPGLDTLSSGAYPYYKTFSVVTGASPTQEVKSFMEFLTSSAGREILLQNGLLVDHQEP
jgi:phosphate transport system substrate-binding protein